MNAVGIDASKGKSMMMALQPMNQVVLKPRGYPHIEAGLDQMVHDILRLLNAIQVLSQPSYSTTPFQSSYEAVSCSGSSFSDFTPSAKSLFCISSA